jgi:hypothetical protein
MKRHTITIPDRLYWACLAVGFAAVLGFTISQTAPRPGAMPTVDGDGDGIVSREPPPQANLELINEHLEIHNRALIDALRELEPDHPLLDD